MPPAGAFAAADDPAALLTDTRPSLPNKKYGGSEMTKPTRTAGALLSFGSLSRETQRE